MADTQEHHQEEQPQEEQKEEQLHLEAEEKEEVEKEKEKEEKKKAEEEEEKEEVEEEGKKGGEEQPRGGEYRYEMPQWQWSHHWQRRERRLFLELCARALDRCEDTDGTLRPRVRPFLVLSIFRQFNTRNMTTFSLFSQIM
jgi:hypothetical protein